MVQLSLKELHHLLILVILTNYIGEITILKAGCDSFRQIREVRDELNINLIKIILKILNHIFPQLCPVPDINQRSIKCLPQVDLYPGLAPGLNNIDECRLLRKAFQIAFYNFVNLFHYVLRRREEHHLLKSPDKFLHRFNDK